MELKNTKPDSVEKIVADAANAVQDLGVEKANGLAPGAVVVEIEDSSELNEVGQLEGVSHANKQENESLFARIAGFASGNSKEDEGKQDKLTTMPKLPSDIFDKLPELLKKGCEVFDNERDRDIFLTGSLGVLSACVFPIHGIYDKKKVYANLNSFVVAPPSSGKGALIFSKALGQAYHDKIKQESKQAIYRYEQNLRRIGQSDEPVETEITERPTLKILYIPGNISSAALIKHLADCEGKGVLCETEADTITNSLKQDWGGYSDLLRKAFHHETISYSRKGSGQGNSELIEIQNPRLSVVISGTHSQVAGLIKSVEDGLYSRFVFYTFQSKPEWRDVSPQIGQPNLTDFFSNLSLDVLKMVEFLEKCPAEFQLTAEQFGKLNAFFKTALSQLNLLVGEDVDGTVKRLGLVTYRIALILSAIRKFEALNEAKVITCSDGDFEIAMKLTETYLQHAIYMMSTLPKAEAIKNNRARRLFEALTGAFPRQKAIEIGEKLGMKMRTIDNYLKELTAAGLLIQPDDHYGVYQKV